MKNLQEIKKIIINGGNISQNEALFLYENAPLDELCNIANDIRKYFCGDRFDICTIINGKSGKCSENCKFCAQSSFYKTKVFEYPLLSADEILKQARLNFEQGILRFSIVTSGRKLSDKEIDEICKTIKRIREEVGILVCASFGLLSKEQFQKLKEAGVSRIHNNLETSRDNFKNVCTTHTFDDKVSAIKNAKEVGLSVCSGGIIGLGETVHDRINMAFCFKELDIKSVPLNILNPIKGTPFENNKKMSLDEIKRIVAIYRLILPYASIRLAGGRGLLPDKGKGCFLSGANSAISGDMLTTSGITVDKDMKLLNEIGYTINVIEE